MAGGRCWWSPRENQEGHSRLRPPEHHHTVLGQGTTATKSLAQKKRAWARAME